ncbi:RNA polymerase sigma factor RpoE [Labilithrix luteola]|uniref:RNA polymerase sigma factor RpoE n=1 Tax=Labilithrix luteola TaxID=1391654 RepID=A0A0K1QFX0_9BACT|nr:sigma-70 family RNA polymerase sigma factor [Labilithrix luteola]AKV04315.1 RNA polymerase sigma factor RpoE [Labilithrix luteola]
MRIEVSSSAALPVPTLATEESSQSSASERLSRGVRLRTLIEAHGRFLWRNLRRLGVPQSLLEDAVQQVFVVASLRLDDIQPGAETAFLFRTAMNVAAHVRRKRTRKPERPLDDEDVQTLSDPTPTADDLLDRSYARRVLDEILDEMTESLRVVFVLHEFEEASLPKIAEYLAIPVGTATSRLRRAREEFELLAASKVKQK